MADLAPTPDLTDEARDVLDWLADEYGGQEYFAVGEHWAPYPTDICDGRIAVAIESLSECLDQNDIPDECPPVSRAVLDVVKRLHAAKIEWSKAWQQARDAEQQRILEGEATAQVEAANAARVAARRARQADVMRRILDASSGATEAEREQARARLNQ